MSELQIIPFLRNNRNLLFHIGNEVIEQDDAIYQKNKPKSESLS
jgi:hypothetical protein